MLKKTIIFSTLLAASANVCFAAESTQIFEVSLKDYHYRYAEVIGDSETARMKGIHLSYKNQAQDTRQYWKITYDQTKENSNYDGALTSYYPATHTYTTRPYQGITNNKIINREITFGSPVSYINDTYIYTGVGAHNWNRNLNGSGGYLEKYSWNYIPVGYRGEYKVSDKWSGGFDVSVRFMFNGAMSVDYNGGSTSGIGDNYNLGKKMGFKIELPYLIITRWTPSG